MNITKTLFAALGSVALTTSFAHGEVTEHLTLDRATGEVSEFLSVELPVENIPAEVLEAFNKGDTIESLTVLVPQVDAAGKLVCYLKYKLDRCWIKSWSTSGDADDRPTEEVAFYYNKITFDYPSSKERKGEGTVTALDALLIINQ